MLFGKKSVKKMNNVNTPLPVPNCIAGVSGRSNFSELWKEQFSELLNCISDTTDGIDCHCCYTDEMMVSVNEVNECRPIRRLECNKACGLDGVSAEPLNHCSSRITPLLAMCITYWCYGACFFLPESMMYVVLIPIIKDKKAKISSIDNYRPVAIASVVSKVVERILLDRVSGYLDTMGNQFGFKPKLGTDMCIYSLKEIIGSYSKLKWMCFLMLFGCF